MQTTASENGLFDHLINIWEFYPGPVPGTCDLYFLVDFKFQSPLYRQVNIIEIFTFSQHIWLSFDSQHFGSTFTLYFLLRWNVGSLFRTSHCTSNSITFSDSECVLFICFISMNFLSRRSKNYFFLVNLPSVFKMCCQIFLGMRLRRVNLLLAFKYIKYKLNSCVGFFLNKNVIQNTLFFLSDSDMVFINCSFFCCNFNISVST